MNLNVRGAQGRRGTYRAKIATDNVMRMKQHMMMMVTMMKVVAAMFSSFHQGAAEPHLVQGPNS